MWGALGTPVLMVAACLIAGAIGAHHGRTTERNRWISDKLSGERAKVFEAQLRKATGARPMHAHPEDATIIRRVKIRR